MNSCLTCWSSKCSPPCAGRCGAAISSQTRASAALNDLGALSVELYPSLPLRSRAWELRESLTASDALFVALADRLEEPLLTKDRGLAAAARTHAGIVTIELTV